MRAVSAVAAVLAIVLSGQGAFGATDLGPAAPYGDVGQLSLGGGYAYYSSEWKSDSDGLPVDTFKRNTGFIQLSYAFTGAWEAYVRGGFANAKFETRPLGDPFNNPIEFSDGFRPMVGLGFKGLAHNGENWDIGPFVQYNVYSEYSELWEEVAEIAYRSVKMTYENMWDLSVGAAFSYESDFAILTLAPYIYWSRSDGILVKTLRVNEDTDVETTTAKLEEKNVVGGMFGVMVPMGGGFALNLETQYQSGLSFSVSGTKVFGSHD